MLMSKRLNLLRKEKIGLNFVSCGVGFRLAGPGRSLDVEDYHRDNTVKRKELLQKLNQGMAYRYIVRNVLPELRRAEITVVREVPEMEKNTFERYLLSSDCLFQSRKRRFRAINLISRREKVKRVWLMRMRW